MSVTALGLLAESAGIRGRSSAFVPGSCPVDTRDRSGRGGAGGGAASFQDRVPWTQVVGGGGPARGCRPLLPDDEGASGADGIGAGGADGIGAGGADGIGAGGADGIGAGGAGGVGAGGPHWTPGVGFAPGQGFSRWVEGRSRPPMIPSAIASSCRSDPPEQITK